MFGTTSPRESSIFDRRFRGSEMMDDFSIRDERLVAALEELRLVNRMLGGHHASLRPLRTFILKHGMRPFRLLDLGTGIADLPERVVRWAERRGIDVEVTAVDANPRTIEVAGEHLRSRLPRHLFQRIRLEVGDVRRLRFGPKSFDAVHAALLLHHFDNEEIVDLLREMTRLSSGGWIINDLHRHPISYHFVRLLGKLPLFSEMFSHDGPVSVLRGFRRHELTGLIAAAGARAHLEWHPGFRWVAHSQP